MLPRRWGEAVRGAVLLLAILSLSGCGASPILATYEGDDRIESFMQADFTRFFRVHVPRRTELGPAAPLVLAFHGSSQNSEQLQAQTGLDRAADEGGFIVAYLEAPMGAWDVFDNLGGLGLDDLAYVREVINRVDRAYVMDRRRVIAVGLSNGGVFSQQLGCKLADEIAGFVSVAASMPRLMAEECAPSRPVSALYLLGTADPFFPVTGSNVLLPVDSTMHVWAQVNGCPASRSRAALPDLFEDGTVVYRSRYWPCSDGVRTELDSIVGGGHAWPSSVIAAPSSFGPTSLDISANDEIIRFLETIPRN